MTNVMNQRTAAVIDPILSNYARGYKNSAFISTSLFPRVPVSNRSMRVLRFGKDDFRLVNTKRAPGAARKRIQYGFASDPIALNQDSLEGVVPIEHQQEAQSIPGVDLGAGAVKLVVNLTDLGAESEAAKLARDPNLYDNNHKLALAGTDRWTSPNSDPETDMDEAQENVRRSIGQYANTLALSAGAFKALKRHPKIKDQFKYTSSSSITTAMLASFFDVANVVVGRAVYLPENAPDNAPALDIWGNDAILAYVPADGGNYQEPSYGYTYELSGYPQVEQPYFDRSTSSWIYPTTVERRPYLVGAEGGFLFQNAGAKAA